MEISCGGMALVRRATGLGYPQNRCRLPRALDPKSISAPAESVQTNTMSTKGMHRG